MVNNIIISGYMAGDPEIRTTPAGSSVIDFRIGIPRKYSKENKSDFVSVVAWRNSADIVGKYFHKGKPIDIEGYLIVDRWKDKNGNPRETVKIVAERVSFSAGDKPKEKQADGVDGMPDDFDPFGAAAANSGSGADDGYEVMEEPEDMPF